MPWRFLAFLLALVLYVVLREFQRTPKCPHCAKRAGRYWEGHVGKCKRCGEAFRV
jgi:hypothetical protein